MHWFIRILYLFGLFYLKIVKGGLTGCQEDKNCDLESVCYDGVCQKCLDCKLLFRKGRSCKFDFSDCGDCLEGYEIPFEEKPIHISLSIRYCTLKKVITQSGFCSENKSCPKESYCLNHSCVKCFDCNLYNRLPPENGCAKHVDECGSCHTGFSEVPVTTYSNSKPCTAKEVILLETQHEAKVMYYVFLVLPAFMFCIYLVCLLSYKYLKNLNQSIESKLHLENPPLLKSNKSSDLYKPSAPVLPQNEPPSMYYYCSEELRKLNEDEQLDVEFVNEEMQNAKVYQSPTAPYYIFKNSEERINVPQNNNNENFFGQEENHDSRLSSFNQDRNDSAEREEESLQPPTEENLISNLPIEESEDSSARTRNEEDDEEASH